MPEGLDARTIAATNGVAQDTSFGAVIAPIHLSTTFKFPAFEQPGPYDYSRLGNPTRDPRRGSAAGAGPDLFELLLVGVAHPPQEIERLARLVLVDHLEREADVDEHPVTHLRLGAEGGRDRAPHARDLRRREARLHVHGRDDLRRNR